MNEKLEPCPFGCPDEPVAAHVGGQVSPWVITLEHLDDCPLNFGGIRRFPTKAEAIAAWNRRVLPGTGKVEEGAREKLTLTIDELAQEIRRVDGDHENRLGAGALAEALMPRILSALVTGKPEHDTTASAEWQLVPKEPTPEMVGAWYRYKSGHRFPGEEPSRDTSDYGAYRAMLAAAPTVTEEWLNSNEGRALLSALAERPE